MKNTPVCLSESCGGPQFRDVSRARRYAENTRILDKNNNWTQLCFLESLYIKRLNPALSVGIKATKELRLRSHGNDIVPLSYRSDFWNGKVDCSHGSGPLSYQFWDLFTRVRYRIVSKHFAPKQAKENLICQQIRVISI